LSASELVDDLPQRSTGAIEVVRQGICSYHRDGETHGILSRMMVSFLERRRGSLICAVCSEQF
jgi:hypothetical protein